MLSEAIAESTSRRGFLARAGRLLLAVSGGGFVAAALGAQRAEAYHFCGHVFTTGSCPHPTGLPRVDRTGFPLRAVDGHAVDDLGRPIDKAGRPVDSHGHVLLDPDGNPLPPAPGTHGADHREASGRPGACQADEQRRQRERGRQRLIFES